MPVNHFRHQAPALLALLAGMALAAWAYAPGSGGGFQFDDQHNLAGLSEVVDARSALEFTVSGTAGPLGRPLALASFLLDRPAWPHDPGSFLRTNILIHLLNGLLVAWLIVRLGLARGESPESSSYAGALTAALWTVMPILASASLMIVQRMTTLSAAFVLLGLIAYLGSRRWLDTRPRIALAGMSTGLVVFTLLAVLTKENGALLPVFALVLEGTVLPRPTAVGNRAWRTWQGFFLWVPLAAILAFLATMVPYSLPTVEMRDFNAWERVLTQAVVLWQYLFHAFLPIDTASLGPFQDTRPILTSLLQLPVALAVTAWLAVAAAATVLRRRFPVISFAVFWYLAGHLIESSVVPLELYFEHRNYLPLIGPIGALAFLVVRAHTRLRAFAIASVAAYAGLLSVTLSLVTATWGQPLQAAISQYEENPRSERAIGFLFAHLRALGATGPALRLVDRAIERGVAVPRYRVAEILLACRGDMTPVEAPDADRLAALLRRAPYDKHLPRLLYLVTSELRTAGCTALDPGDAERLVRSLRNNPSYRRHKTALYWTHRAEASFARQRDDRDGLKSHLHEAVSHAYDPDVLEELALLYARDGNLAGACRLVDRAKYSSSWNPTQYLYRVVTTNRILKKLRQTHPNAAGIRVCNAL